jgi:hypothetical protein
MVGSYRLRQICGPNPLSGQPHDREAARADETRARRDDPPPNERNYIEDGNNIEPWSLSRFKLLAAIQLCPSSNALRQFTALRSGGSSSSVGLC